MRCTWSYWSCERRPCIIMHVRLQFLKQFEKNPGNAVPQPSCSPNNIVNVLLRTTFTAIKLYNYCFGAVQFILARISIHRRQSNSILISRFCHATVHYIDSMFADFDNTSTTYPATIVSPDVEWLADMDWGTFENISPWQWPKLASLLPFAIPSTVALADEAGHSTRISDPII